MKNQRSWLPHPQTLGLSAGTPQPVPHLMCSGSSRGSQGSLDLHLVVVVAPPPASLHTSCSSHPFPVLEAPRRSGSRARTPRLLSGEDAPCSPAVTGSQPSALCCADSAGPSGRRRGLSVCLPLPLPSPHPTARVSSRGAEGAFLPLQCMQVRGLQMPLNPTGWP